MARTKIEDRGFQELRSVGRDPAAAFLLRIIGPGVRQEVSRVQARIAGFLGDVSDVFLEAEGKKPRGSREPVVIDAEIVDETPLRPKK
jgi:hypothetical protein